jgi:AP endonuclease-1
MARKLSSPSPDSELSSAPDDDVLAQQAEVPTATEVVNGTSRKRKADTVTKTTKRSRTTAVKAEAVEFDAGPKRPKRAAKVKVAEERTEEAVVEDEAEEAPKRQKRARKVKVEEKDEEEIAVAEGENGETTVKAKSTRQKKVKEDHLPPLKPRTVGSKLRVGAHVSIAGGKLYFPSGPSMVRIEAKTSRVTN